jgi:hypothetical protein
MADGTNADPIIIETSYTFALKFMTGLLPRGGAASQLIEDTAPQIRKDVRPGQCFAFKANTAAVFILGENENGALYFVRWPALRGFARFYLPEPGGERPWLQDMIGDFNRRVRELNPFAAIDKFME